MDHSMKLLTNANVHNYRTRNSDKLRLSRVTRNCMGKQRVCYQSLKDWNVDRDTRNSTSIRNFYIKSFNRF